MAEGHENLDSKSDYQRAFSPGHFSQPKYDFDDSSKTRLTQYAVFQRVSRRIVLNQGVFAVRPILGQNRRGAEGLDS
jgi:hypothetical protein